jgi:tRNA modification GTPase
VSIDPDTIVAIATASGKGGIGIVRISGANTRQVAEVILGEVPEPRNAHYSTFLSTNGSILDQGIAIFYPGPHSFTGEDVLELQGHGGPVVLDLIVQEIVSLGARVARPGEFSERAFLNDKIDLSQAEAIADLIDSASQQAVKGAVASLQGEFSRRIDVLVASLIELRVYVEASIDFPEEEVDFLSEGKVTDKLNVIYNNLEEVQAEASQGSLLREGMTVVIAGRPNAGKSSLLNRLSGREVAIVTATAGTTRDLLKEYVHIDGMPLHLVDTAGLRAGTDEVEEEGIRRAWREIKAADRVLLLVDASESSDIDPKKIMPEFVERLADLDHLTIVRNKVDLLPSAVPAENQESEWKVFNISAKTGYGANELRSHLKECMGFQADGEGKFIARRRHLDALQRAKNHLTSGRIQLSESQAGELLAEDLRMAQQALGEITGSFTTDDLLGQIFSSFCIGK